MAKRIHERRLWQEKTTLAAVLGGSALTAAQILATSEPRLAAYLTAAAWACGLLAPLFAASRSKRLSREVAVNELWAAGQATLQERRWTGIRASSPDAFREFTGFGQDGGGGIDWPDGVKYKVNAGKEDRSARPLPQNKPAGYRVGEDGGD